MVEVKPEKHKTYEFAMSLLAFWIKSQASVDRNFLHLNLTETSFGGLVPTGEKDENIPLPNISNVSYNESFSMGLIAGGIFLCSTLILLPIGVLMILNGIKTTLTFKQNGRFERISVPVFNRTILHELSLDLTKKIANYQDDRNIRMSAEERNRQSAENTQAIVNALRNK